MSMSRKVLAFSGAAILSCLLVAVQTANASTWNKKTTVKFPEAVELPGNVTLQPGSYVLKLADSSSNRHIVQVFNEDENKIFATILAIPAQRMEPADKTVISFYETPRTQPMFIKTWFYPGDTIGQEFAYSKDRAAYIASLSRQEVPSVDQNKETAVMTPQEADKYPAVKENESNQTVDEDGSYAVEHGYTDEESPDSEAAVSNAPSDYDQPAAEDNEAMDNADEQAAAPADQGQDQDQQPAAGETEQLPRTASYAPLAGLAGFMLIGTAGLMRAVRKNVHSRR